MAALYDTDCGTHPACNLINNNRVRPVSDNNLALHTHTAYDMTILSVTVCGLVLIHEIHVDTVIWKFLIELCM